MPKVTPFRLGELQLKIMKVLWLAHTATIHDVHSELKRENLAYTTIATMLRKMEARGLVDHIAEGRIFIYRPLVAEAAVTTSMTDQWVEKLFSGSLSEAVNHLLTTREVSRKELDKLERLIAEKKKKS